MFASNWDGWNLQCVMKYKGEQYPKSESAEYQSNIAECFICPQELDVVAEGYKIENDSIRVGKKGKLILRPEFKKIRCSGVNIYVTFSQRWYSYATSDGGLSIDLSKFQSSGDVYVMVTFLTSNNQGGTTRCIRLIRD